MKKEMVELTFKPLSPECQKVVRTMFTQSGGDPVKAYEQMAPALLMVAAICGMKPEDVAQDVADGWPKVEAALDRIALDGLARIAVAGSA